MLEFNLTYAGTPFILDTAQAVRIKGHSTPETQDENTLPPRKYQPLPDLIDELNRLLPTCYLSDFVLPSSYPGRNLGAIAMQGQVGPDPESDTLRVGDWYYPVGATRWSVFRGLATSSMLKAMLAVTGGTKPAPFVMKQNPVSPNNPTNSAARYTLTTNMYMLPARPLGEQGGQFDGLYLVTLVDERYHWQSSSMSLRIKQNKTWNSLLVEIASELGIAITAGVSSVYLAPEPDSQFWSNLESTPALLDAIAFNVGAQVVRSLNGTYSLLTPLQSQAIVNTNRGTARQVVRVAGGDMFASGNLLPVGDLTRAKNSVLPASVDVTFPKYIVGDDPVPHFLNARYANQRPSIWYEESYGDTYIAHVPITAIPSNSGGLPGVSGVSASFHDTAKALYPTEALAVSGLLPVNSSGLRALATQIADDYFNSQVAAALDEVYPGTFVWTPEGIHDIIWTYSARSRLAATRVMKCEWNQAVREYQHSTPPDGNFTQTNTPKGVGGPSVALSIRDSFSGSLILGTVPTTALSIPLLSGDTTAYFNSVNYFPTQNRWRGVIDGEVILFEGTSGGLAFPSSSGGGSVTDGCCTCQTFELPVRGVETLLCGVGPGTTFQLERQSGSCTWASQFVSGYGSATMTLDGSGHTGSLFLATPQNCVAYYSGTAGINEDCIKFSFNLFQAAGGFPNSLTAICIASGGSQGGGGGAQPVNIVYRGIDGTLASTHSGGSPIRQVVPDVNYGTNLITFEKGQAVYPQQWTSGGIQGLNVVPQIQIVRVTSLDSVIVNGIPHFPGKVELYDTQEVAGSQYFDEEDIWIVDQNTNSPSVGRNYKGLFVGHSAETPTKVAPVYTVESQPVTSCSPVHWRTFEAHCVEGLYNEYHRDFTLLTVNGCPQIFVTDKIFDATTGCCECSSSLSSSSTSFSSASCTTGNCTLCTCPPFFNQVLLSLAPISPGFPEQSCWARGGTMPFPDSFYAGSTQTINLLSNPQTCLWEASETNDGGSFSVTWQITPTNGILTLTQDLADGTHRSATYITQSSVTPNCCGTDPFVAVLTGFQGLDPACTPPPERLFVLPFCCCSSSSLSSNSISSTSISSTSFSSFSSIFVIGCCGWNPPFAHGTLDNTLHLTFIGGGGCECLDGITFAVVFDFGANAWLFTSINAPSCTSSSPVFSGALRCNPVTGEITLNFTGCLANTITVLTFADCSTPIFIFGVTATNDPGVPDRCCIGNFTVQITL